MNKIAKSVKPENTPAMSNLSANLARLEAKYDNPEHHKVMRVCPRRDVKFGIQIGSVWPQYWGQFDPIWNPDWKSLELILGLIALLSSSS